MGGMFSSPKSVKAPPPPAVEPPPSVEDTGIGYAEKKKLRRRKGYAQTFLTGDLIPETAKKAQLG